MIEGFSQISIPEFISDYCDFGIYNGLYCVEALMSDWDNFTDTKKCLITAKIYAEYGRSIEEMFVFIYAMHQLIKSESSQIQVFWNSIVNYDSHKLNKFIRNTNFTNIPLLLGYPNPDLLSEKLQLSSNDIETVFAEIGGLLEDLKIERLQNPHDETVGQLQRIYNKLKHPFLVISLPKEMRKSSTGFGVMQRIFNKGEYPEELDIAFECIPVDAHVRQSFLIYENIKQVTYNLMFLLKCFKAKYEIEFEDK